jgi:hypothetical protein
MIKSEGGRVARSSPVVPLTAGVSERDAAENNSKQKDGNNGRFR